MQVAVVSDIHGNLPALEAVVADIDRLDSAPDEIWCLGDIVGYGAQPDGCTTLIADRARVCLAGNHDLGVRGDLDLDWFSSAAAAAARWTRENIEERTRDFLSKLEPLDTAHEAGLFHASPRDPVWEYVLSTDQADACLDVQEARVCLIGHSHVACHFSRQAGGRTDGRLAPGGFMLEVGGGEWLVNPGSVGQPRDGDPRAAYLLLDTEQWTVTFHRVEYEIERAAQAIIAAGLPNSLAERLYLGQ